MFNIAVIKHKMGYRSMLFHVLQLLIAIKVSFVFQLPEKVLAVLEIHL